MFLMVEHIFASSPSIAAGLYFMILKSLKDGRKDGRAADGRTVGWTDSRGPPKNSTRSPQWAGWSGEGRTVNGLLGMVPSRGMVNDGLI